MVNKLGATAAKATSRHSRNRTQANSTGNGRLHKEIREQELAHIILSAFREWREWRGHGAGSRARTRHLGARAERRFARRMRTIARRYVRAPYIIRSGPHSRQTLSTGGIGALAKPALRPWNLQLLSFVIFRACSGLENTHGAKQPLRRWHSVARVAPGRAADGRIARSVPASLPPHRLEDSRPVRGALASVSCSSAARADEFLGVPRSRSGLVDHEITSEERMSKDGAR